MTDTILVTGAAGGAQGSTGLHITEALIARGFPVRAFVHKLDARSKRLHGLGAEVVQGNLLNTSSVRAALQDIRRAYFTFPVNDGLLEATTIFAAEAKQAGTELVVNNSQFQGTDEPPTFRNLQHRLGEQIFDWASIGAIHLQAPPYYENLRALISKSVSEKDAIFLPWGKGDAVFPLTSEKDMAHLAAELLINSSLPTERTYRLVGETLTVSDITHLLGQTLGRPIRYVEITDEQWADAVRSRINPLALNHLSSLWKYFRSGSFVRRRSAEDFRRVTRKDPMTLEVFFQQNAEAFCGALQNV